MADRDPLIEELAALDPVRFDPAPPHESTRYAEILRRAMRDRDRARDRLHARSTFLQDRGGGSERVTIGHQRSVRRSAAVLGAVAAIVIILVGFMVIIEPDRSLSPAAALTEAVENTEDALTLRSEYVQADPSGNGAFNVVRSEHRGADLRRTFSVIEPDGTERPDGEDDEFRVYIGDRGWTPGDGPDDATVVDPEQRNAPYAESSAAIIRAAVDESPAIVVGEEEVRGTESTHYRITLDEGVIRRLGELRPNQLSAFELENPSQLRSLDVWIGGGYIRRLRVIQTWEQPDSPGTTVEFYDFGADITITPPS